MIAMIKTVNVWYVCMYVCMYVCTVCIYDLRFTKTKIKASRVTLSVRFRPHRTRRCDHIRWAMCLEIQIRPCHHSQSQRVDSHNIQSLRMRWCKRERDTDTSKPLDAGRDMQALANSASNLSNTGAPNPLGTFRATTSTTPTILFPLRLGHTYIHT
jgi:hypothetical protein